MLALPSFGQTPHPSKKAGGGSVSQKHCISFGGETIMDARGRRVMQALAPSNAVGPLPMR